MTWNTIVMRIVLKFSDEVTRISHVPLHSLASRCDGGCNAHIKAVGPTSVYHEKCIKTKLYPAQQVFSCFVDPSDRLWICSECMNEGCLSECAHPTDTAQIQSLPSRI